MEVKFNIIFNTSNNLLFGGCSEKAFLGRGGDNFTKPFLRHMASLRYLVQYIETVYPSIADDLYVPVVRTFRYKKLIL